MTMPYFYKERESDRVYWVDMKDKIGLLQVSFDKKNILNLWTDYPSKFTKEQKEIFDKEQPFWAGYFGK